MKYTDKLNRLYLSNKYIKVNDDYYKLYMFLEITNFGHTNLVINDKNKDTKYDLLNVSLILDAKKYNFLCVPIIYVYKKVSIDKLFINNEIITKDINLEIDNLKNLKKFIPKNNLYEIIFNTKYDESYYEHIYNYMISIYNNLLYLKKVPLSKKDEDKMNKLLSKINKSYNDNVKSKHIKIRKDIYFYNFLYNNPLNITPLILLYFFNISKIETHNIKNIMNFNYNKQSQEEQYNGYNFYNDIQQEQEQKQQEQEQKQQEQQEQQEQEEQEEQQEQQEQQEQEEQQEQQE